MAGRKIWSGLPESCLRKGFNRVKEIPRLAQDIHNELVSLQKAGATEM